MGAGSAAGGSLVTRVLRFGSANSSMPAKPPLADLWVNVQGAFSVTLLTAERVPLATSGLLRNDSTKLRVSWNVTHSRETILRAIQTGIRLRFELHAKAKLFSFWFSDTTCGTSGGHVAAGGPPYASARDEHCHVKTDDDAMASLRAARAHEFEQIKRELPTLSEEDATRRLSDFAARAPPPRTMQQKIKHFVPTPSNIYLDPVTFPIKRLLVLSR